MSQDVTVPKLQFLVRSLALRDEVTPEEQALIESMTMRRRLLRKGEELVAQHSHPSESCIVLSGFTAREVVLDDGKRQITALHIPGDFVDLHGFTLKRLDHDIITYGPCTVALVPHERLKRVTQEYPHLTRMLWLSTMIDAALHREWELSLGRRDAVSRVAHIFCELEARLDIIGMVQGGSYALPLSQVDLAECLGITSVHVNRVLRQLRDRNILEFSRKRVTIRDRAHLREIAEFDIGYLYIEKCPR